ncbi:hypothetical protein O181_040246 [Austropuccinia psidii MF-1]|uniref:Uncharacterized protein n=1 Tax=Austropuccinia psidii MF-1 TaxID=1389203 RepID=A0A9Q3HD78_9BASI|nr:hypothetical protein [Austropuccinia psidii MF-1]
MAQNKQSGPVTGDQQSSSDNLSEPETFDLLKHLKQPPIETMYDVLHLHDDEVTSYLQNTHPMTKGKHILDFWKPRVLIFTGNVQSNKNERETNHNESRMRASNERTSQHLAVILQRKRITLSASKCGPSRPSIRPSLLFVDWPVLHLVSCLFPS